MAAFDRQTAACGAGLHCTAYSRKLGRIGQQIEQHLLEPILPDNDLQIFCTLQEAANCVTGDLKLDA
jgi:hypothetical protein